MQPQIPQPKFSFSKGFAGWLSDVKASLIFSAYDGGIVFSAGLDQHGNVNISQQNFGHAMGIAIHNSEMLIAAGPQIIRLRNILDFGRKVNDIHDACFVPLQSWNIGNCDAHEVSIQKDRAAFVNTRYSAICEISTDKNFCVIWRPPFVSATVPEDRCHLNGFSGCKYVTAIAQSDALEGWRKSRENGGVLIDIENNKIVLEGLSMPHSPRVHNGTVYFLDSGHGWLSEIGPNNYLIHKVFLNGFARGLSFIKNYAICTVSLPRNGIFHGLELQRELYMRNAEPWCGVLIIDLQAGGIVEWLRIEGQVRELFDVAISRFRCPLILAPGNPSLAQLTVFE